MIREPDRNFDPPEDEPEFEPNDDGDNAFDRWNDAQNEPGPIIDRDCDYWNRIK